MSTNDDKTPTQPEGWVGGFVMPFVGGVRYGGRMFVDDDHPSFTNRPSGEESVWRYMDLARYLSLIQSSSLHFARADQMSDRWEGSFGQMNLKLRPEIWRELYDTLSAHVDQNRRYKLEVMHLNCWHLSSIESAAMWDIYQREGRGVAVRSTWSRLTNSIKSERQIHGAKVKYVDYNTAYIPEENLFDAFLHKRESFAHEREVRLIALTGRTEYREAEAGNFFIGPEDPVLPVEVDLVELVEAVYVAPDAPAWIVEVVESVTRQYGLRYPVQQSDLATDPIA